MNSYCLTIKFNGPPSSMTLFQGMTGAEIVDYLPITKDEMHRKEININFFSIERLDADGKPVVYQDAEDVAILSVEEQAHITGVGGSSGDTREQRTGAHLLQMARSMGWKDDGEGALEFMLRRAREVAFEDCGEATLPRPHRGGET